jgi:hypothetical protein
MKKYFVILASLFLVPVLSSGQSTDPLISKCAMNTGKNSTYLKDFRVQLGKVNSQSEMRYKQVFPLSKNMRYRFTLCNADNSNSELIMKIMDDAGRVVLASFDQKSGKTYPNPIDFVCNKTGIYHLYFDFRDFQQGLGVGIISLVK